VKFLKIGCESLMIWSVIIYFYISNTYIV
jgi:hypothetical protein